MCGGEDGVRCVVQQDAELQGDLQAGEAITGGSGGIVFFEEALEIGGGVWVGCDGVLCELADSRHLPDT